MEITMIYKIAICDDSKADAQYVSSMVERWAAETGNMVSVSAFVSAEAFLFHYEQEKDYDILLLDIEMGQMNGVELAKKIRCENREVQIVFVTGYNDYIADGYDVEALHYILKPVRDEKLYDVLKRACEKLNKNKAALVFDIPDGVERIPLYEIRYIEVRSNYVTIHGKRDISVKSTLSAIEQKLDDSFFRVGRSFIVNMQYIRKITKTEVFLDTDTPVPLSRGFYEPLNRAFINHF